MISFNPNSSKKTFKERFWFAKSGSQHNPRPITMADLMNFCDWTGLEQFPIPQPIPVAKEAGLQDVNFYSDRRYFLQYFPQWKDCVVPGEKEGFWEKRGYISTRKCKCTQRVTKSNSTIPISSIVDRVRFLSSSMSQEYCSVRNFGKCASQ